MYVKIKIKGRLRKINKYTIINNKNLAYALSFCGFEYYVFDNNGKKVYSFEKTEDLIKAIQYLTKIRKKNNHY